jgi:clan AA aspartic protease
MIHGAINADREAVVILPVRGSDMTWRDIAFIVDTGFSEYLSLPQNEIDALGLSYTDTQTFRQSDGSVTTCPVYIGIILWDGQERILFIQASEGDPLLGMALLHDHRLIIDVRYQGNLTIEALP